MRTRRLVAEVAIAVVVAGCSVDGPSAPARHGGTLATRLAADDAIGPVYLVRYASGTEGLARAAIAARGGRVLRHLPEVGLLYAVGLDATSALSLEAASSIAGITQDRVVLTLPPLRQGAIMGVARGVARTNGTDQRGAQFFARYQWNMSSARADVAWTRSNGGAGRLVCVLDTGIDPDHQDLAGRVDLSRIGTVILRPLYASDRGPLDYNFHGTFVAAIITSNGIGVASTAPDARLCSIKVVSQGGQGRFGDVVAGITQAVTWGADVVNLSLRWRYDMNWIGSREEYQILRATVLYAASRGTTVVAAEGNEGINYALQPIPYRSVVLPAMTPGVIGVGATGPTAGQNFDDIAAYSNRGSVEVMDLVAPGGGALLNPDPPPHWLPTPLEIGVVSACSQYATAVSPRTCSDTSYFFGANGTSLAAPMVAGAVAVVQSTVGGPMTPGAIAQCLRRTADKVGGPYDPMVYGAGRLNVLAAARTCTRFG